MLLDGILSFVIGYLESEDNTANNLKNKINSSTMLLLILENAVILDTKGKF
jgi:hypothetical protein